MIQYNYHSFIVHCDSINNTMDQFTVDPNQLDSRSENKSDKSFSNFNDPYCFKIYKNYSNISKRKIY